MKKEYLQAIITGNFIGYIITLYANGDMFGFFTGLSVMVFMIFKS